MAETTGYWERITQTRLSRRRALGGAAALGAGAAALSLVGCGGGGGGGGGTAKNVPNPNDILKAWQLPNETKGAKPGGIYKAYSSNDITGTLDPTITPSFTTLGVADLSYETLLQTNSGPGIEPASAEGRRINGRVAEAFEVSADASKFTFKLRPNVKFHNFPPVNGRVMDIDDWRVTLERVRAVSPLLRASLNEVIDKLEFPDAKTMVVTTKYPYIPFLRTLTSGSGSFYVMPKEIATSPDVFALQTIGSNYRLLDKIQPSVGREYKTFDQYWAGAPFISRVHYPIIPEASNQRAQYITGSIILYGPPPTDVLQLRSDYPKGVMLRAEPGAGYQTDFFGVKEFATSPWGDERVRHAMRMSVDWDAILAQQANATQYQAVGLDIEMRTPTHVKAGGNSYPYWVDPKSNKLGDVSKFLLFNLDEAKKLLAAAGVKDGFEMDGYMNGGTEYGTTLYPEAVQLTVDQLAKNTNIKVKINRIPYAEFVPNYYRDRAFKGMVVQQPEFTYVDVDLEMFNWFHSRGSRLKINADPKVDDFIDRQRKEIDDTKRAAIIADFQKYMAQAMPSIPGSGIAGSFYFIQPWLRNLGATANFQWIDETAPRRDTA